MTKITMIPLHRLRNNTGQIHGVKENPRDLSNEQFLKTVESIRSFPEMLNVRTLVVVDYCEVFVVIGGNQRLRALQELKYTEAPCVVVGWDTDKINEFIIKDNLSYGDWDWDILANQWEEPKLLEWGLDIPHVDLNLPSDLDIADNNEATEATKINYHKLEVTAADQHDIELLYQEMTDRGYQCKVITK